jgi:hypothetical protein
MTSQPRRQTGIGIREGTIEEYAARLNEQTCARLGIGLAEFVRCYESGQYDNFDDETIRGLVFQLNFLLTNGFMST